MSNLIYWNLSLVFFLIIISFTIQAGENLAYHKSTEVSSSEANYPPENAVDGDGTTQWISSAKDEQYFIVDLQKTYSISKVKVEWGSGLHATQFQIQVSNDNQKWSNVYENYEGTGGIQWITFNPVSTRYVKLFSIRRASSNQGFSVIEFEIYESTDEGGDGGDGGDGDGPARAAASKKLILDYLYSIKGKQTIIGIHNREPNSDPDMQTEKAKEVTGQYAALWSGDFLFSQDDVNHRWDMIKEAKKQWDNGSIVQVMAHVTPPTQGEAGSWEGGVQSQLSDDQWNDLITDGGNLNKAWKKRLDGYAEYLGYLRDNGVPVLFRPLHEANENCFWWSGRKGQNGSGALFRLTRDYLEKVKGFDNLIWIWDVDDWNQEWSDYNPGNNYWDIFGIDFYNSDRYTRDKYNKALSIAGDKLIAIGECDKLPTASELKSQPEWVFLMSWAELTFSFNSNEEIQNLYFADNTIIRKELPSFK